MVFRSVYEHSFVRRDLIGELRMNCEKHEEELHHMGTDHCAGSPCQHGTCENLNGGYFCNCDTGWEGKTCGDDFNECIHFGSSE